MTPKHFLVTGCSTGIGLDAALALDRMGHQVFAGVRSEKVAEELRSKASLRLIPLILDITKEEDIDRAFRVVSEKTKTLDGLVNNAGIVVSGPLEFIKMENLRQQFEVNVLGHMAMIQKFLPLIRAARGRIVNVGSVSGFNPIPFVAPYSASKHAIRALTDCLRLELMPWEISVSLIEPGPISTPIWEKSTAVAQKQIKEFPPEAEKFYGGVQRTMEQTLEQIVRHAVSVNLVTKAISHALFSKRPRMHYRVGPQAKLEAFILRFFPLRVMEALKIKMLKLPRAPGD